MPTRGTSPRRWATAEEKAIFHRKLIRLGAHPYTRHLVVTTERSEAVREETEPILLYGWDASAEEEIGFGYVGGPVGQPVGNPSEP